MFTKTIPKMFRKALLIVACLPIFQNAFSQNTSDFKLLKCAGDVPELFKSSAVSRARDSTLTWINQNTSGVIIGTREEKKLIYDYKVSNIFFLEKLLSSGRILYGDEITIYVNKVLDTLLKDDPELRSSVHLYTLQSTSANAFMTGSGNFFVTTGLLSYLKSEAELAYVLCHEISHFTKRHAFIGFKKSDDLRKSVTADNLEKELLKLYSFKRENEYEADKEGFELFKKSRYYDSGAIDALLSLKFSDNAPYLVDTSLTTHWFESERYKISNETTKKINSKFGRNKNVNTNKYNKRRIPDEDEEERESEDDDNEENYATHPNLDSRIQRLNKMIESNKANTGQKFLVGETAYNRAKYLADCQNLYLKITEGNYTEVCYLAEGLLKKYGNNLFLKQALTSSLYNLIGGESENVEKTETTDSNWMKFVYTLSALKKDEKQAILLKRIIEINDASLSHLENGIVLNAIKEITLTRNFDQSFYTSNYVKTKDSLIKNNIIGILYPYLKNEKFVKELFTETSVSEDDDNENTGRRFRNRDWRRNEKQRDRAPIALDSCTIFSPQFVHLNLAYKKSNTTMLIKDAEYTDKLSEIFGSIKNETSANYTYLNCNSNPEITTELINLQSSYRFWVAENYAHFSSDAKYLIGQNYRDSIANKSKYLILPTMIYLKYFDQSEFLGCTYYSCNVYTLPIFIYDILVPKKFQNYSVLVYNLETGKLEKSFEKSFKRSWSRDLVLSNWYDMLYRVKGVKR